MEQAGAIPRNDHRRPGGLDVVDLVTHHAAGYFRMFNGKGAAETAALFFVLQFDQLDIFQLPQKRFGILDDAHLPQRMAGGVPGHLHGDPAILEFYL